MMYRLKLWRLLVVGLAVSVGLILLAPFNRWGLADKFYDVSINLLNRWAKELQPLETEHKLKEWGKR